MVTDRSVAIWGRSESDTRTIAWLAKAESDSSRMARMGAEVVAIGLDTEKAV